MKVASFALALVSAMACIVLACSAEQTSSPREPAKCVFPDGTIRTEGVFACPGNEQDFPCRKCSCEADGTIGSSSYATDCASVYRPAPTDAGTETGVVDADVDGGVDASADGDAEAEAGSD